MRGTFVLLLCFLCATMLRAQPALEGVLVETYYVSDANDATDMVGGGVPEGSVTYRIFLDLCEGCGLRAIYADANHALSLTSTAPFFNHTDRGRSFGHQINNTALGEGTVALDSYMSLGRASTLRLGIPKADDPDGSSVGGANNDGGSAAIPGGLLVNGTPEMGIVLTTSDGLVPLGGQPAVPPSFLVSGDDLDAVFRDETTAGEFVSNDSRIACATPGVQGATPDNLVLIAQLTTTGGLEFRLNVEIEKPDGTVQKYVAPGDTLLLGEEQSGLLVYPPDCGCTDPDFLEYDPAAGCDDGSCATAIVLGCLDPSACNFSSTANFNVPQLCCYSISDCNGLDPYLVCPTIGIAEDASQALRFAPNPTAGELRITGVERLGEPVAISAMDAQGRVLRSESIAHARDAVVINLEGLADGLYLIALQGPEGKALARIQKR
ncbi:MAG: hypothetical protein WAT74_14665 [Flavobacteriales bacterium]